jgi:hypothetical protein
MEKCSSLDTHKVNWYLIFVNGVYTVDPRDPGRSKITYLHSCIRAEAD